MNPSRTPRDFVVVGGLILLLARESLAAWESRVVVGDLDRPMAVAVQPETDHVFVMEAGRGRILRVVDGVAADVVTELPVPASPVPQGLLFLDAQTLLVAGANPSDGRSELLQFRLPPPGSPPLKLQDAVRSEPLPDAESPPRDQLGGMVLTRAGLLVGTSGPDSQGWVLRTETVQPEGSTTPPSLAPLRRFLNAGQAAGLPGPVCLAISPRGELVAGHASPIGAAQDSRITLFRASDQKRLLNLSTDLDELVGLCYSSAQSPATSPLLFAIDRGGAASDQGGLYRLDASFPNGRQAIQTTRVLPLDRPSAIISGPGQGFYVTTTGQQDAKESGKSGRLLQLSWKP